jgi:hypothetical protein
MGGEIGDGRSEIVNYPSPICETPSTVAALAGHEPNPFLGPWIEEAGELFEAGTADPSLNLGNRGAAGGEDDDGFFG